MIPRAVDGGGERRKVVQRTGSDHDGMRDARMRRENGRSQPVTQRTREHGAGTRLRQQIEPAPAHRVQAFKPSISRKPLLPETLID